MPADLALTLVSGFGIFFIGILVYFHDRKSFSNLLFFFISLATVFWALVNYFSLNSSPERLVFWVRLVLFFATPHVVLFLLFVINFPNRENKINHKLFYSLLWIMILAMGAVLSPYVFSGLQINEKGPVPTPGPVMPLFAALIIGSLISGIGISIKKYIKAQKNEKDQWRLMVIGVISSYVFLIITNFILVIFFENKDFIIFGPLYMLPTIIGMSYAILRHHLLNVKTIGTEILVFAILSISLFEIFTSKTIFEVGPKVIIFIIFFFFSILLVKSVLKEVEQREKLEELTTQLEATNVKLQKLDQLKSAFLSFAAHQAKGPINNVKGYASLIGDGSFGEVPQEVKEKALRIKTIADNTLILLGNLLDMRKIEEGTFFKEFKYEETNIVDFVQKMIEEYKVGMTLRGKGDLDLSFESSAPQINIKIDQLKIRQVIQNLVDNSIKYTDKGFVKVSVTDEQSVNSTPTNANQSQVASGYVLITIQDSGRGMSKDLQTKLFNEFVRDEKTAKEIQGTGLGLYIAKQIIDAHKGQITAYSEGEGKGSTFTVTLSKM